MAPRPSRDTGGKPGIAPDRFCGDADIKHEENLSSFSVCALLGFLRVLQFNLLKEVARYQKHSTGRMAERRRRFGRADVRWERVKRLRSQLHPDFKATFELESGDPVR